MYEIGEHEVEDQRGNYLVAMAVAEAAGEQEPEEKKLVSKEDEHAEKGDVKKRGRKPKKQK